MMHKPYIREKLATSYEARLYMGCKEGYDGEEFTEEEIRTAVQEFQNSQVIIPVRITRTCFVAGDYYERGWEMVAINYPRFPKDKKEIWNFMHALAEHLLVQFKQNRITILDDEKAIMVEDINRAEPNPCCDK